MFREKEWCLEMGFERAEEEDKGEAAMDGFPAVLGVFSLGKKIGRELC